MIFGRALASSLPRLAISTDPLHRAGVLQSEARHVTHECLHLSLLPGHCYCTTLHSRFRSETTTIPPPSALCVRHKPSSRLSVQHYIKRWPTFLPRASELRPYGKQQVSFMWTGGGWSVGGNCRQRCSSYGRAAMRTIGALCQAHQSHLNEEFYTDSPYIDTQQGQEFQTCMLSVWLGNNVRFKGIFQQIDPLPLAL